MVMPAFNLLTTFPWPATTTTRSPLGPSREIKTKYLARHLILKLNALFKKLSACAKLNWCEHVGGRFSQQRSLGNEHIMSSRRRSAAV